MSKNNKNSTTNATSITMTKPKMRKKRKLALINYEQKRYLLNRKFKKLFKDVRRTYFKFVKFEDAESNYPLFASVAAKLLKRNIFHKNKHARVISKATLFKNSLKEKITT